MVTILSQWYREPFGEHEDWFYRTWRAALRHYAPRVPVLIVDNGGPTKVPYDDVEVIPAVDMVPHGRGSSGHYQNCWRSMAHGFQTLADRGEQRAIYIGQNLIPGIVFVAACMADLCKFDLLLNRGCLNPSYYFTEYMAANPIAARRLWDRRLIGTQMLEERMTRWAQEFRVGAFPGFNRPRDAPPSDEWTVSFHESPEAVREFAGKRGFLQE